ncbi:substrate-binding periplasmic protein [Rhodobacter calidifons]|uniref:Transporter substrate-binding domain-containing protein n=1 Tax=Rhodobacter calidifons TaxID=2715277 RepID=A0ABX0GB38_9RHOB|nr:transporter substrate-binding domain-containing protein [Rhodobacter calidifons]NHB78527.1 transporter substrate-binding domain-containing protein [Rhodobacter calidifons]
MLRAAVLALMLAAGLAEARCEDHVPGARPQNTPREFVGQTLDEIVARGWIEIAVYENFPPYSWEEGGTPKGVDVEVGRIIAESLGVEPRFRFVQSGETLEADLLNYVWKGAAVGGHVSNLMLRVPYNSDFTCRVEQVVFTGQYAGEKVGIAYRTEAYPDAVPQANADGRHPGAPVPSFFVYDPVGVENDSISDFYLTATFGASAKITRYKTTLAAMEGLAAGEVWAVMGPLSQLEAGAGEGIAVHAPLLPGFGLSRWTLGVALHQSHRDLGYAVDEAVAEALADGRIAAVFAGYGLDFTPPER